MKNREFVQLASSYDPAKHPIAGMMVSEKLDGIRALWLPETMGKNIEEIGWANREKDGRDYTCTGLWSRYGKVINAPLGWLGRLPKIPLDGELWLGRKRFQEVSSVVRRLIPDAIHWEDVKFMVFDSPSYDEFYRPGKIYNNHYKTNFIGLLPDGVSRSPLLTSSFESTYNHLKRNYPQLDVHEQVFLPFKTREAEMEVERLMNQTLGRGGEGLILRNPAVLWTPYRVPHMVKLKPHHDDEAEVVGRTAGKGRLRGMMGALVVKWKGIQFELGTGFLDSERRHADHLYPNGTQVTFRYRELSDAGVPKEGRFLRKRVAGE